MFDRLGIYERFASCFQADSPAELARVLGVHHTTVYQWRSGKRQVPWARLKNLADEKEICWDWLIEGREPVHRLHRNRACQPLSCSAVNERFLQLFPRMTQAEIADELGISQTTVFKWFHNLAQVPWERLKYAADTKGVTWEWILEGL